MASNYLAHARVVARSFRHFHPDAPFWVLLIDDAEAISADGDEPFIVLQPGDIGIDAASMRRFASIYDVLELCTGVKPWLIQHLVALTGDPVVYLDPDIQVFAPMDDLAMLASVHGLAVTPHLLHPLPLDGLLPDDAHMLGAGVYNLGFLAAGTAALEGGFFDYWQSRLWWHSIVDVTNQIFTDQRWLDWVDCFEHVVIRDPGCNVAYWNVWARPITRSAGQWFAEGHPVRFFHFSGFDPETPWILSRHQGQRPRVRLGDHPELAALCRDYADRLLGEGYEECRRHPYGWSRAGGLELTPAIRRIYRRQLMAAHQDGHRPPPGPFDTEPQDFLNWVTAPVGDPPLPRYLLAEWDRRPDLRAAFPDPHGASRVPLLEWSLADDRFRAETPPPVIALLRKEHGHPSAARLAVNVAGYLSAELGVGTVGRLVLDAAEAAGVPATGYDLPVAGSAPSRTRRRAPATDWHRGLNVLCVNADMTAHTLKELGPDRTDGRRTVAIWHWEAQRLPASLLSAWSLVDEVWATSRFTFDALAQDATRPLRLFPLPVHVPSWSTSLEREDVGLPEGYVVLFCFDWLSVVERKNPVGLIEAYSAAFASEDGAHLVIKTINGSQRLSQLERLRVNVDRPDVHVIDGAISPIELKAMIELSDCYVSLHRSEGFGLTMAEAMALGKPVVATAWSGNLDFMDSDVARLVPAELEPIPDDVPVYGGIGSWASPDLDAAGRAIRALFDDPAEARALGHRAREHLRATRSARRAGEWLADQLERLVGPVGRAVDDERSAPVRSST